jgi:hypothetical protein
VEQEGVRQVGERAHGGERIRDLDSLQQRKLRMELHNVNVKGAVPGRSMLPASSEIPVVA